MMFAPLEGWRHVKVTDRHPRRALLFPSRPDARRVTITNTNVMAFALRSRRNTPAGAVDHSALIDFQHVFHVGDEGRAAASLHFERPLSCRSFSAARALFYLMRPVCLPEAIRRSSCLIAAFREGGRCAGCPALRERRPSPPILWHGNEFQIVTHRKLHPLLAPVHGRLFKPLFRRGNEVPEEEPLAQRLAAQHHDRRC